MQVKYKMGRGASLLLLLCSLILSRMPYDGLYCLVDELGVHAHDLCLVTADLQGKGAPHMMHCHKYQGWIRMHKYGVLGQDK